MGDIFRAPVALSGGDERPLSDSIAEVFHENTKLHRGTAPMAGEKSYSPREIAAMAGACKRYRLCPHVTLPQLKSDAGLAPFGEVVNARRSGRAFGSDPLSLAEVSTILQWSYGITGAARTPGGGLQHFRSAPSAGALYPAEMYLGVRAVQGLERGIYHYEVPDVALALLELGDPTARIHDACCGQEYAHEAGIVVLISAVIERTRRKYSDRGYRYILLDIGHLGQNLYLACAALDLVIVTTCGFFDDEAADILGIDGTDEAVFYVAFIGRPPAGRID